MKLLTALLFGLLTSTVTSYAQQESSPEIPNHAVITKKYSIDSFNAITSNMIGQLRIVSGSDHKVEANGTFETVSLLRITCQAGVLDIEIDKEKLTTKLLKNSRLTVTVTTPTLTQVSNQGVSNLTIGGDFNCDHLTIESKGVGNIQAESLNTKRLTIHSEGVGNVKVKGSSEWAAYDSKGVGNIEAKELQTKESVVYQKGIGSISCHATKQITVNSKGIGSVSYYGNPQKREIEKKGIGSVTAH